MFWTDEAKVNTVVVVIVVVVVIMVIVVVVLVLVNLLWHIYNNSLYYIVIGQWCISKSKSKNATECDVQCDALSYGRLKNKLLICFTNGISYMHE